MKHLTTKTIKQIKLCLYIACSIPFAKLLIAYFTDSFGPDPVAVITHTTGVWALNLLMATLMITPLRNFSHWQWLARLRRPIAIYAFVYASLHVLAYFVFDQFFDWPEIGKDITKRPYMMAGMASFVLMLPLVVTSTTGMMKRMGGRRWQMLHRLTYPVAVGAVLHYFWLVKLDITQPAIYAIILLALFCARLQKTKPPATELERLKGVKDMKSA